MRKFIVTTTINKPTEALIKFSKMKDWTLIVVGDKKTPHSSYESLNCLYLSPQDQEQENKELSDVIGWNCIQRRSLGFIKAKQLGAEIVATVDDDNIPLSSWGKDLLINKKVKVDYYETENEVFDPLSVTNYSELWHRGFPIELLPKKNEVKYKHKAEITPLVQADLWNGNPDVDAIGRIAFNPEVKFTTKPFTSNKLSPFNSQNTFLSASVLKDYYLFPAIGRMDDIWASYVLESRYPASVVYGEASVYQRRNPHSLYKDLEAEMIGYKNTLNLVKDITNFERYLPERARDFVKIYAKLFT